MANGEVMKSGDTQQPIVGLSPWNTGERVHKTRI